jgi:hypothetical protein
LPGLAWAPPQWFEHDSAAHHAALSNFQKEIGCDKIVVLRILINKYSGTQTNIHVREKIGASTAFSGQCRRTNFGTVDRVSLLLGAHADANLPLGGLT